MQKAKQRISYLRLYILVGLLLAWCGMSCCSIKHSAGLDHSSRKPHDSFLYIQVKNLTKRCRGNACYEALYINAGSGFSIAPLGGRHTLAITAGHVCAVPEGDINKSITATALGGATYNVVVIDMIGDTDTCVLAVLNAYVPPLKIAENNLEIGDPVIALGAPLGIFQNHMIAKFSGYYSGLAGQAAFPAAEIDGKISLAGYTIPARPGSSGGPILNESNEVVGMMVLAHPTFETFALSPTQDELRLILKAAKSAAKRKDEFND